MWRLSAHTEIAHFRFHKISIFLEQWSFILTSTDYITSCSFKILCSSFNSRQILSISVFNVPYAIVDSRKNNLKKKTWTLTQSVYSLEFNLAFVDQLTTATSHEIHHSYGIHCICYRLPFKVQLTFRIIVSSKLIFA